MKELNIGICGLGTVGSGVFDVLSSNSRIMFEKSSCEINIVHIATRSDNHSCDIGDIQYSKDVFQVAKDPNVDLVVELIGGTDVAFELVMLAISNKKHVVTANKALIAEFGAIILEAAMNADVNVAFEASVAGGIPVLKGIREGLVANNINWLAGIINGTTNFILSEMSVRKTPFEVVLAEAQSKGYAEADPTFDVEGIDASQKLAILASLSFGIPLSVSEFFVEGITSILLEDVSFAKELGFTVKHIGICREINGRLEARVHPALIPDSSLLAHVNGVSNAVMVNSDAVDTTLFYGPGAGSKATASSVIADIIDVAKSRESACFSSLGYPIDRLKRKDIMNIEDIECGFYIRFIALDKAGVLSEITTIMANASVSIESIIQRDHVSKIDHVNVVIITSKIKHSTLDPVVKKIKKLKNVVDEIVLIRVEHLDQ